jgi:hypothetical protein
MRETKSAQTTAAFRDQRLFDDDGGVDYIAPRLLLMASVSIPRDL